MAGTLIVEVRKTLIAQLVDGDVLPSDVEVRYQYRAGSHHRKRVWTRRGRFTHAAASMRAGRNFRDETGRFEVVVLVEGVGLSAEDTSQQAVDLGVFIEDWIAERKNNELGIAGLQTLTVAGDGEITELFNDNGHLAELTLPVTYTARLT